MGLVLRTEVKQIQFFDFFFPTTYSQANSHLNSLWAIYSLLSLIWLRVLMSLFVELQKRNLTFHYGVADWRRTALLFWKKKKKRKKRSRGSSSPHFLRNLHTVPHSASHPLLKEGGSKVSQNNTGAPAHSMVRWQVLLTGLETIFFF